MEKEIQEGNNLIAKFLGYNVKLVPGSTAPWDYTESHYVYNKNGITTGSFNAHLDMNLLNEAVEKFEKMNYGFKQCRKVVEMYVDSTKETLLHIKEESRRISLFKALIIAIMRYNENTLMPEYAN